MYCAVVPFSLLYPHLLSSPSDRLWSILASPALIVLQTAFPFQYSSFISVSHGGFLALPLVASCSQDDCSTQAVMFTWKEGSRRSSSVHESFWHASLFYGRGELLNPAHPQRTNSMQWPRLQMIDSVARKDSSF